jgi:hypothetical protein
VQFNFALPDLQSRVSGDPFIVENKVTAEVIEITPSKTDQRLAFSSAE